MFATLCLCLVAMAGPVWGAPETAVSQYLEAHFPAQYQQISSISQRYGKKIVFPCPKKTVSRGQELLVLERKQGVPVYLLPQSAVIKILSTFDGKALASIMLQLGASPKTGDPVVIPAAPLIYLYTNLTNKNSFPEYQRLLQTLLKANYQVIEIYKNQFPYQCSEYGLLIRLEYDNQALTTKICSLFTGNTFFTQSYPYSRQLATFCSPGIPILFNSSKIAHLTAKQTTNVSPPPNNPLSLNYKISLQPSKQKFMQPPAPGSNRSIRLDRDYSRLAACSTTAKGQAELAMLNRQQVVVYASSHSKLIPMASYKFQEQDLIPFHLHALDLDHDGQDELLVSILQAVPDEDADNTRLCSQILSFKNGQLIPVLKKIPFYLRVIEDRAGHKVLLGQKKGATDPYTGDIYKLTWRTKAHQLQSTVYLPAKDVYSIYQFNLIPIAPQHIFILEPSNFVSVYFTPKEKLQAITDKNFGSFCITPCKIKLAEAHYLGGFNKKTSRTFYAPRRFVLRHRFADQVFLINKQRETNFDLKKIKKVITHENAEDNIVALKWTGHEIRQTWQSPAIAKDILDFTFFPKGNEDQLCLLLKDRLGCLVRFIQ